MQRLVLSICFLWALNAYSESPQQTKTEPFYQFPVISVPMDKSKPIETYSLTLEENPPRDLQKKVFKKVEIPSGEVLDIRSVVISDHLLAIMSGLTVGTDALQMGEIESGIDTDDPKKFLELIVEIARERRHAETDQEWSEIVEQFGGRENRARFNAYLYSTPYLEVVSEKLKAKEKDTRYFVPIKQMLAGAGQIDTTTAKIKIIQSLSLMMFKEFDDTEELKGKDKEKLKLREMAKSFSENCHSVNCNLLGEAPIGLLLVDLHMIYRAGSREDLIGSKLALLRFRKQICLFSLLHATCPGIPGLQEIDEFVKTEELDCKKRETILRGLTEESE